MTVKIANTGPISATTANANLPQPAVAAVVNANPPQSAKNVPTGEYTINRNSIWYFYRLLTMQVSDEIKVHLSELKQLRSKRGKDKRRKLLTKASTSLLYAIFSCCLNVLNTVVELTEKQRDSLLPYRFFLLRLIDTTLPIEKKRELLIKRSDFLPALLAIILDGRSAGKISTRRDSKVLKSGEVVYKKDRYM